MTVYVKPIFIRPNGTALAGGFVKVLESGSNSTLKTTYSNSAMTVPNTNPIVLDGSGRANIWFTGPADYEVYDSNMVLQYRQPGVYGLGSASINIDSVDRTKRNLRGEDDINETLGTATERCGRFIRFDCDGEPELLTDSQVADIVGETNIFFIDLGFTKCTPTSFFDFGYSQEEAEVSIDLGINLTLCPIYNPTAPPGPQGPAGRNGDKGWSPVLAIAIDGLRRVLEIVDWVGGSGVKPTISGYISTTGVTSDISSAVDIRGPAGSGATVMGAELVVVSPSDVTAGYFTISQPIDTDYRPSIRVEQEYGALQKNLEITGATADYVIGSSNTDRIYFISGNYTGDGDQDLTGQMTDSIQSGDRLIVSYLYGA